MLVSCQKQSDLNGNIRLTLSDDTLNFDTVFTATATITRQVKLVNNNNQEIGISSVSLAGGANSSFIMNVDGTAGTVVSSLNIPANDSLIIFVTVFIHPGSQPSAF
ncbi:MAG TPA: hypothetical protein VIL90_06895, partial [Puia sp.]